VRQNRSTFLDMMTSLRAAGNVAHRSGDFRIDRIAIPAIDVNEMAGGRDRGRLLSETAAAVAAR